MTDTQFGWLLLGLAMGASVALAWRQASTLGLLDHIPRDGGVIVDRIGVRHRANTRPTTRHRRRTPRRDRLLMLLPRLAKMYVKVNKTRGDKQTACVKNFAAFRRSLAILKPAPDDPLLNKHAHPRILRSKRVNKMSVGNK